METVNNNNGDNVIDYVAIAHSQNFSYLRQLIQEGHDVQQIFRHAGLHLVDPQRPEGVAFLKELIEIHGVNIQVCMSS